MKFLITRSNRSFLYLVFVTCLATSVLSCSNDDTPFHNLAIIEASPTEGVVGTEITLTGMKFNATISEIEVFFNGVEATIINMSDNELQVAVPENATTGKISIKVKGQMGETSLPFKIIENPWVQKESFAGERTTGAVSFAIKDKGYVGLASGNDFWEYDPSTDQWTQKADYPGSGTSSAVGFSIGSKGYIGIGRMDQSALSSDFYEYDPSTDTWSKKADFPGEARHDAVGFSVASKGYIGCGNTEEGLDSNDFWEYDPSTDQWTQKADFPGEARDDAVGFGIDNKGFIGLGSTGSNTKDFWEYDPSADKWTQKADFGGGVRANAVAFVIGGVAYVGTGYMVNNPFVGEKDFWKFDPAKNNWVQVTDFFGGKTTWVGAEDGSRTGACAFVIGAKGYVGTGYGNNGMMADWWEYTPE